MQRELLIVGQGLAGTVLAWACEEAGLNFRLAASAVEGSASAVSAGILNPVTGRRIVKSWRADALLPLARATYRRIEAALGASLWREFRIRRWFADDREREVFFAKSATGELAPFVGPADDTGFWIEGAAQVDFGVLLSASRDRWRSRGRLTDAPVDPVEATGRHAVVIDCRGLGATAPDGTFGFVPWEFSKGELLEIATEGLAPDVIVNRRHWVLPTTVRRALVGATHEPGQCEAGPTAAARAQLKASVESLLGRAVVVLGQRAGIRVNLPDKRPVVGRHPRHAQLGLINGLGAKGAMLAPYLAAQWVAHLRTGAAFDREIDVARFVPVCR